MSYIPLPTATTNPADNNTDLGVVVRLAPHAEIHSFPPEWVVQHHGDILGKAAKIVTVFGYRNQWNSTSVAGDVCAYLVGGQDRMNTPAVGTTYYINSTSTQDATGGSGVDRIRITYLDSAGDQQVSVVNLDGTTAVSIGSGYTFIQWMETYHSVNSDVVAVGNVTISSINGVATEATTMEMVLAGGNRSQSFRYKVPTGYHAHLLDYHMESNIAGNGANTKLRATLFQNDGLSTSFHFVDVANLPPNTDREANLHYRELPAGCIIKLSCIPGQIGSGNRLTGSMDLIIMES